MQLKGESTANHEKNDKAATKDLVETRKQETTISKQNPNYATKRTIHGDVGFRNLTRQYIHYLRCSSVLS